MSLSTLRKNFYRIATLIIDHGADSLRCLLDHFIQKNYKVSFKDFVTNHQHEIYHQFNNAKCCQCSRNYSPHNKTTIGVWQMERLFDKNRPTLPYHKPNSKCEYCCSTVRSTLQIEHIDITLLRFFLVTYFEEEFWKRGLKGGLLFHDFLNTHKHDIFHLLQLKTPCCLCIDNREYTTMVATEKDRLNKTHWEKFFQTTERACTYHRNSTPNDNTLHPCSVSATIGICHSDLDGRARMIILSKFCDMMSHIDQMLNARNSVFAHALKGELSDEEFRQLWNDIENSIIYVSDITSTAESRKLCILELREKSLEESMCLELQCLILKQMQGDEPVLKTCRKLQDTVETIKESIDLKLQQIELQITAFTSNIPDVVRNELSIKLNEYSDTTRNIIDNTKREIEFHDEDKTYVKTRAVTTATKLLDSNNLLLLFGRAGSGKTSTALEIASLFHANGYIVMKLEQHFAKDFKTYFVSKNKQLIIFEDLFGKVDIKYNEDLHSNLLEVLKPHVFNGVSKFIITIRSYKNEIDDEIATYHQLLSEAGVVNLNVNLSYFDKERILTMHATHNGSEISNMHDIIATKSYLGFPEACRLFCSFENFFAMGHAFFTSPTVVLQNEISVLKRSGYMNIDSAIQYCVLIYLMMDSACKESFDTNIRPVFRESNDPTISFKNINCSIMENLYISLFHKEIMITMDELHEICKQLSSKYIQKDSKSNTYVFQHETVFEAVLASYWHHKTMDDVIKDFKADILAKHVRPFDSIVKVYKKGLIVPMDKCTDLAHNMFEAFLANYNENVKCYSLIDMIMQSKFMLTLFNLKLDEWCTYEANILKCDWNIIKDFIRPFNHKKENNIICANADDKFLIQKLLKELDKRSLNVHSYIKKHGSDEFVTIFNEKLTGWLQSEGNVVNCDWYLIEFFIRPTTFTIENGQIGSVTNDDWLIQGLINLLVYPELCYIMGFFMVRQVKTYITEYGCENFITLFNEKLRKRFQSEENVVNCNWHVIELFIRPTTFTIENGQIGTFTNDGWLIEKLINTLENIDQWTFEMSWVVQRFIIDYACEKFVTIFNKKLKEWFESKENVVNCDWHVIKLFIRPTTFTIGNGKIGTVTNDGWLVQRLINRLVYPWSFDRKFDKTSEVNYYIESYGCEKFVKIFNEKLAEWLQTEENVINCEWDVINYCIRPSSFIIENGHIGTGTNNDWLIQRLVDIMTMRGSSKGTAKRTRKVKNYIAKYGCKKFVNCFKKKLTEWIQQNMHICNLHVFTSFVRPQSWLDIEKIRICLDDEDVIMYLLSKLEQLTDICTVKSYIRNYGSCEFRTNFNERLKEKVERIHEHDQKCTWEFLELFFDNAASSDSSDLDILFGSDIGDVSDLESSISFDTISHSADSESDSNIDFDSKNHSEDNKETNNHQSSNNDGKNGV